MREVRDHLSRAQQIQGGCDAVTRAGEARERPSLGTVMEDMMSHHKPFPYLLGAMIGL